MIGKTTIFDCSVIELDRHPSERLGNLSVVQSRHTIPFDIKRIFYIYDVPGGESRGGHAHLNTKQFVVALSGSFSLTFDDGRNQRTIMFNRPYMGLLVEPGIWLTLNDFSSGAVAMVLTSEPYDESDYIRDYDKFLEAKLRQ